MADKRPLDSHDGSIVKVTKKQKIDESALATSRETNIPQAVRSCLPD